MKRLPKVFALIFISLFILPSCHTEKSQVEAPAQTEEIEYNSGTETSSVENVKEDVSEDLSDFSETEVMLDETEQLICVLFEWLSD